MASRTTGGRSDLLEVLGRVRSEAAKLQKHRLALEVARSRDAADED